MNLHSEGTDLCWADELGHQKSYICFTKPALSEHFKDFLLQKVQLRLF